MPSGYALTEAPSFDVVSAYSAPTSNVPAVASSPGWTVIGSFYLPLSGDARLDVIGSVSAGGLTARVRLFDVTSLTVVPGDVSLTSTLPQRALGPLVALNGQRHYQVQVECVGAVGEDKFAAIKTVGISE